MKHYDDLLQRLRSATKLPMLQALMNEGADAIAALTAADVRPVVRGRWMTRRFSENYVGYECLNCHTTWDAETNFCPNCGAYMRIFSTNCRNSVTTDENKEEG